jgi:hypothetical protein
MVSASWPEPSDYDLPDATPWDRRAGESTKQYQSFRIYRDLDPTQRRLAIVADRSTISERQARVLAARWDWQARADAWDDECHRVEDRERLEAIRGMHKLHRAAGRHAITKALQGLQMIQPENMSPGTIARLLELGAKLERSTLIVSVEELQGIEVEADDEDDPWERIAADLAGP